MKKTILSILLLFSINCYCTTYTSIVSGNWNTSTNWSPAGVPTSSDIVIISNNKTITYSGNLNMGVSYNAPMNLTIDNGSTLITLGLAQLDGSKSILTNNGVLNITGNLSQNPGTSPSLSDRNIIINNNILNLTGNFVDNQNTTLTNNINGVIKIANGSFTHNSSSILNNSGVVNIDNTNSAGKVVSFSNLNFSTDIFLNTGSKFNITKSDLNLTGYNSFTINGKIDVYDGNITSSLSSITISNTGGIYTNDTDNNGDGVFNLNGGGASLTNNGDVYVSSLSSSGGGITITDNKIMFIANISTGNFDDGNNIINVSSTGQLYYCYNPVRHELNRGVLGVVVNGGKLYYSNEDNSYPTTTPNTNLGVGQPEVDFTVSNTDQISMSTLGISNCKQFYDTKVISILPIDLLYFDATKNNKSVLLEWKTLSEKNNDFFSVLKSFNGVDFNNIFTTPGCGTCNYEKTYSYIDDFPQEGVNYYRLKQTDVNGQNTTSKTKSVLIDDFEFLISFPDLKEFKISFNSKKEININIEVFNELGASIIKESFKTSFSENDFCSNDFCQLTNGVYYIVISYNKTLYTKKIVIKD